MNNLERDLELNWRQIPCTRGVQGSVFPIGVQEFPFSVSGKNSMIPALCYFKLDAALTGPGGAVPTVKDGLAFAEGGALNMYQSAKFLAGQQDVSVMNDSMPQSSVLRARLDRSSSWIRNVGRSGFMWDYSLSRRIQKTASDGRMNEDSIPENYRVNNVDENKVTVAYTTATKVLTFVANGGTYLPDNLAFKQGDTVLMQSAANGSKEKFVLDVRLTALTFRVQPSVAQLTLGNLAATANWQYVQNGVGEQYRPYVITNLDENKVTCESKNATTDLTFVANNGSNIQHVLELQAGDVVVLLGVVHTIVGRTAPLIFTVAAAVADVGANADFLIYKVNRPYNDPARPSKVAGQNDKSFIFQPPLGIMNVHDPLSGGDFKFILNPNTDYRVTCVESLFENLIAGVDFDVVVSRVFLYIATVKMDTQASTIYRLPLIEYAMANLLCNPGQSQQSLNFTVPPSTRAVTIFFQYGDATTNCGHPITRFKMARGYLDPAQASGRLTSVPVDETLRTITVTYGMVSKPANTYDTYYENQNSSLVAGGTDQMYQRWIDTYYHAGTLLQSSGIETFDQWRERGPIYHFDFSRDKTDASTYLSVLFQFNKAIPANTYCYVCSHYSRQVEIQTENGIITQVVSINR